MKLPFLLLGLLMLPSAALAESPRVQLKQMVEQLQKAPDNDALRVKIIKLARTVKPAPAVSDEARRFEGRGKFAFKNAKSNEDYLKAAKEYEQAVAAAPWVPGYYSDLCTIYEKAGDYAAGKRNCDYYLIGLSDPAQIAEAKERIAGLEYGMENPPKAPAAVVPDRLSGTWTVWDDANSRPAPAQTWDIHLADYVIASKGNGTYQMQRSNLTGTFFPPERRHETWTFTVSGGILKGAYDYDGIYDWGGGSKRSCEVFQSNATGKVYGDDKDIELKYTQLFLGDLNHCETTGNTLRLRKIN